MRIVVNSARPTGPARLARLRHLVPGLALGLGLALASACSDPPAPLDAATVDAPTHVPLGLNDVSILFPAPSGPSQPGYLLPTDVGARGELLPLAVFDTVPTFPVTTESSLAYARMRTVAIRFDACGGSPDACEGQIRLVMQPVNEDGTLRDSALHLFYRVDTALLPGLVQSLRQLRALAPEAAVDAPLDVHPALVAQGLDGAYATTLRDLVLAYTGEENLTRVTFFLRAPPTTEVWFFGGFSREGGIASTLDIVGVGEGNQRVIRTEVEGGYQFDLTPVGTTPEDHALLEISASAEAATDDARAAAFRALVRVQNPAIHPVDDLPCAGCHVAHYLTAEAGTRWGLHAHDFPEDAFTSPYDLTVRSDAHVDPSSLRAFGYFGSEPRIVLRTVQESAAVLAYMEEHFPD